MEAKTIDFEKVEKLLASQMKEFEYHRVRIVGDSLVFNDVRHTDDAYLYLLDVLMFTKHVEDALGMELEVSRVGTLGYGNLDVYFKIINK